MAKELSMDYSIPECKLIVDAVCKALEAKGLSDMKWDQGNVIEEALFDQKLLRYRIDLKMIEKIIKQDTTSEGIASSTSASAGNRNMISDFEGDVVTVIKVECEEVLAAKEGSRVLRTGEAKVSGYIKESKTWMAKLQSTVNTESQGLSFQNTVFVQCCCFWFSKTTFINSGAKRVPVVKAMLDKLDALQCKILAHCAKCDVVTDKDPAVKLIADGEAVKEETSNLIEAYKTHQEKMKAYFDSV